MTGDGARVGGGKELEVLRRVGGGLGGGLVILVVGRLVGVGHIVGISVWSKKEEGFEEFVGDGWELGRRGHAIS